VVKYAFFVADEPVDQWLGNLFVVRQVSPDELESMTIQRLIYWQRWHILADDYERKELDKIKRKSK